MEICHIEPVVRFSVLKNRWGRPEYIKWRYAAGWQLSARLSDARENKNVAHDQAYGDINTLFRELEDLDDPRQGVARVQERMRQYREAGLKVPEELVRTERQLKTECALASQGR